MERIIKYEGMHPSFQVPVQRSQKKFQQHDPNVVCNLKHAFHSPLGHNGKKKKKATPNLVVIRNFECEEDKMSV